MSNQDTCKFPTVGNLQPTKPKADDKTAEWVKETIRMKQSKIEDFFGITSYETAKNLLDSLNSINSDKKKINFIAGFMLDVCHICEAFFKEKAKEAIIDELCSKFREFLAK